MSVIFVPTQPRSANTRLAAAFSAASVSAARSLRLVVTRNSPLDGRPYLLHSERRFTELQFTEWSVTMNVLIAGAGPTGLTLAIELARRGIDVRVVDQAEHAFIGSRGDGLQPRTLEVFEDLGVLDAVL